MTLTRVPNNMLAGAVIPVVTSIADIKSDSLNPDEFPIVRLRTNLRDQEFEWLAGNYTTRVAADLYNGRYIKKDSVAASSGCWVAVPQKKTSGPYLTAIEGRFGADEWNTCEFSVPNTGDDATPALTAMYNLANIDRPGRLQYDFGLFTLSSGGLPSLTYQSRVRGNRNGSYQQTIIQKDYVEPNSKQGVLSYNKWAFELEDISITATAIASGGSAISVILLEDDIGPGDAFIRRPYVASTGFNHALHVNGLLAVGGEVEEALGYRHLSITEGIFLNAADYVWDLNGMRHLFASNTVIANNSGNGNALNIDGNSTVVSDDIQFHGLIAGKIDLDYCERCQLVTQIGSDVTNTANTKRTTIVGSHYAGVIQSNWTDNSGLLPAA